MPHGAAGPERGVETPNLMTSAATARPGLTATSTRARSANPIRGAERFIARSLLRFCTVPIGDGTIVTAVTPVNPLPARSDTPDDRAILIREASDGLRERLQVRERPQAARSPRHRRRRPLAGADADLPRLLEAGRRALARRATSSRRTSSAGGTA